MRFRVNNNPEKLLLIMKKMREAGFEPAHPEIRRLKRRDINRASRFARTS